MKFSTFIFGPALLAATVLAAPPGKRGSTLEERTAQRLARNSKPLIPAAVKPVPNAVEPAAAANPTQYSSNWGGTVLTAPPSGQTFNKVIGTFTVPRATKPSGASGSGPWAASAWVGIDGDTYGNAILQTGIDVYVYSDGSNSWDAWYEWYPDYAYNFNGFSISAGNVIRATALSYSSTSGIVTLENLSTGQKVSKSLNAPCSGCNLGGQNAEWIVEDFSSGGSLVPMANFGSVTFSGASATTYQGSTLGISGATIIDIVNSAGQPITSVQIQSNSQAFISYV